MKFKLLTEAQWQTAHNLVTHFKKHVLDATKPNEPHDDSSDIMREFVTDYDLLPATEKFQAYSEDLSNAPCENLMPNTRMDYRTVYGCMINYKGRELAIKAKSSGKGKVDVVAYNPSDDALLSCYRMDISRLFQRLRGDWKWAGILDENKTPEDIQAGEVETEDTEA